jgi:UDP-N-acetylglucosamine/UDP-N-acetylgalactosamine diphosphorylase
MEIKAIRDKLQSIGQGSVFRFWDRLDEAGRGRLGRQLQLLDLTSIAQLVQTQVKTKPKLELPREIQPARAYPRDPKPEDRALYRQAEQRGMELLRGGKVGAFLVAGGQGTRLGYDGPKGEFPVTPIRNKPLFQVFAEQLDAWSGLVGKTIPWYIMTSDINDGPTRAFFQKQGHFGYDSSAIFFFQQGMMPAFAADGQMLLAEESSLALSPDGHGGSLGALARSGALADMKRRGIEQLSYFQVDNPMVQCIDPLFLGLHDLVESEMSSKTIPKADALEKVGNFVLADGVLQVIEYSDLPESLAKQTDEQGKLRFNAGSIAIHALKVGFIERLNEGGRLNLPWHRAEKKVPYVDQEGRTIKPDKPNAIKLEQFVFDAIPLANNPMVYTTERSEEFSPVKNADGNDSPITSRRDQVLRAIRWLKEAGVEVQEGAMVEISPLFAVRADRLAGRTLPRRIVAGESVYLE